MSRAPDTSARERILDAACALIAERGIGGARIAQIARAAGVSTSLVHYHFRTREALLSQTLDYAFDRAAGVRVRATDEPGPGGSGARRLAAIVGRALPSTEHGRVGWQLWMELWLGAARDPALRPIAAKMYGRYRAWIADAVAAGVAAGEFAAVDAGATADLAMALVDGLGMRVLAGDPAMPIEEARTLIGHVLARELEIAGGQLPCAAAG